MAKRRRTSLEPGTLGALLRELRERKGLTLEALGSRADLSFGFVSELEHGTRTPSRERLGQLLGLLDATDDDRLEAYRRARMLPDAVEARLLADPTLWRVDVSKLVEAARMARNALRGTPIGDKIAEALNPQPW